MSSAKQAQPASPDADLDELPNGLEQAMANRCLAALCSKVAQPDRHIAGVLAAYRVWLKRDWLRGEKARAR